MPPIEPLNMPADAAGQEAAKQHLARALELSRSLMNPNAMSAQPVDTEKPKRILFMANGSTPADARGIVVPRHMWYGATDKKGRKTMGMSDINKYRAQVYGSEERDPLTKGQIQSIHNKTLDEHFKKPLKEQMAAEKEALQRLRAARHIHSSADTLDKSEKLDTVNHEHDSQGRTYDAFAAKGVAGHAIYSSGTGANERIHILNTCPGQTEGCGGGKDSNGIIDTSRGTCFAPNAESQYVNASIRRACHAQAKHDPAMTRDWILAHTGALRKRTIAADKKGKVVLFRPNVVDESDNTSSSVIRHLNEQRKKTDPNLPMIISNSYGKTGELHDPENGTFITHSNVGPKVKDGMQIPENMKRDDQRIAGTITAQNRGGTDFTNAQGHKTPTKGSYFVTDVKRNSPMQKKMEAAIKYAKYWSRGRPVETLKGAEAAEGPEGHFDGNGNPTTPDKAHYGHTTLNGRRYDYQKQHVLHPRLVYVGDVKNPDTGVVKPHYIPTDSRFKDTEFLPKRRFKSKVGKDAGHILMTTPTESTSNAAHKTSFTHHVGEEDIAHALANNGEYEVDSPAKQEAALRNVDANGNPIKFKNPEGLKFAHGGSVVPDEQGEMSLEFPERDFRAVRHLMHRDGEEEGGNHLHRHHNPVVDRALRLTSHLQMR